VIPRLELRSQYWQQVKQIDLENLVFVDEMGVLLGMMLVLVKLIDFIRVQKLVLAADLKII
jgi:hypothetical protein